MVEKAFCFLIQMTLENVLVQRVKKKEMDEKVTFKKDIHKCYKASKFLWKNHLAKSLFKHEINFEIFSLKNLNIRGVIRTQSNISDGIYFRI